MTPKYHIALVDPSYLRGKRVLLLAPEFFNICRQMCSAIRALGATVDYYDTRPDNSFLTKAIIRVNQRLLAAKIDRHYARILEAASHVTYDYILLIKGEGTPASFIASIKDLQSGARLVYYNWDAISYYPKHFDEIRGYFDRVLSFDPDDCRKYGMDFLPLFYDRPYEAISHDHADIKYDALFVGTLHTDRYQFICKMKQCLDAMGYTSFFYPFMPHRQMYLYDRFISRKIAGDCPFSVKFVPMPQSQLLRLYAQSRIVLDLNRSVQSGLTLRTMETLGAQRKLITTNADIANYDFYNPQNILIVDRNNPKIPRSFMDTDFIPTPTSVYAEYSIANWVANVLSE